MKNLIKLICICFVLVFLFACTPMVTNTKAKAFEKLYEQRPLTVLALPPINTTTAPLAKEYVICTIPEPLTNAGYYLIPMITSNEILQKEGLYDTEVITPDLYPKLKELFNADAILITQIFKWNTSYYVIGGNVSVGITYTLISTSTGEELWKYSDVKTVDTTQRSQGGGMIGLAVALAATAATTASTDYVPIAKKVNDEIFSKLPAGKYSPRFNLDGNEYVSIPKKNLNDTQDTSLQNP